MSQLTNDSVMSCVAGVKDPEIGRPLGELRMIKEVSIGDDHSVSIRIELPTPAYPGRERIVAAIQTAMASVADTNGVNVDFSWNVKVKDSGGNIGLKVKNVIAVGSGKGGVGKSTVAACLAYGLHSMGAKVGLMDADVYGPSIPHMMKAAGQPAAQEHENSDGGKFVRMAPIDAGGIKLMSMGFFVEKGKAVVWRGPMLHKALTQFLKDTEWGELDYLFIDLPPGTGDVSLTLAQLIGLAGAVIVCTPQQVALLDAEKAVDMYKTVKVPILGVVENMTGEIFGRGGAKRMAETHGIPFLGEIPMEAEIRVKTDEGNIASLFDEDNPARPHLLNMCEQTAMQIAKQLLETPKMPTLELL
jgi:ATP-binding protein involved in chromosome partitioning